MKCKYCNEPAVTVKKKIRLCKNHFNQQFIKKIKKVLKKVPIKDKKILIAVSGGKDSVAILHALQQLKSYYNFQTEAIFIHLGIGEFSEKSLEISNKICNSLSIKLNILNLKEEYGFTTEQLAKLDKKVCSNCGTVKRYVLNDFAYKNNFDFIITGHNMDDEVIFLNQNILSNNIEYVKRYSYFYTPTLREVKLIGKIKPQFFIPEQDNLEYCKINNLSFVTLSCPHSNVSSHKKLEQGLKVLNESMDYSYNFLQFFIKINKYLPETEINFKFCSSCGFPTVNYEQCKFCKMRDKLEKH